MMKPSSYNALKGPQLIFVMLQASTSGASKLRARERKSRHRSFQIRIPLSRGPNNKDYSILVRDWGPPIYGNLPSREP